MLWSETHWFPSIQYQQRAFMNWGAVGFLVGVGIAILLYIAVRYVERDYYKRKHEIIRKKLERVEEAKRPEQVSGRQGPSVEKNEKSPE